MKLNESGKEEVRKLIEELVKKVPEGQRIKLPKDVLEGLMFYNFEEHYGKNMVEKHRVPIWTGKFLRKIDLSELNFTDSSTDDFVTTHYDIDDVVSWFAGFLSPSAQEFLKRQKRVIDFSYTNINLQDLSSVWPAVGNCNFEGVDLSKTTLYPIDFIADDELVEELDGFDHGVRIKKGNNFKNTGLNIVINDLEKNRKMLRIFEDYDIDRSRFGDVIKYILEEIKKGTFDGCYLNGLLIENGRIPTKKDELLQEYGILKDVQLTELRADIERQIAEFEGEEQKSGERGRK